MNGKDYRYISEIKVKWSGMAKYNAYKIRSTRPQHIRVTWAKDASRYPIYRVVSFKSRGPNKGKYTINYRGSVRIVVECGSAWELQPV